MYIYFPESGVDGPQRGEAEHHLQEDGVPIEEEEKKKEEELVQTF